MAFFAAGVEWVDPLVLDHILFEFVAIDTSMAGVVFAEFVAAHAVNFVVATADFKPHWVVTATPNVKRMTGLAVGAGRQVDGDIRGGECDFVAVETGFRRCGELEANLVIMTLNTVCSCVCAPEWEGRCLV